MKKPAKATPRYIVDDNNGVLDTRKKDPSGQCYCVAYCHDDTWWDIGEEAPDTNTFARRMALKIARFLNKVKA